VEKISQSDSEVSKQAIASGVSQSLTLHS